MALTVTNSAPATNAYGGRKLYTVDAATLASLGAFTTGTINLDNLPAGAVIRAARWKHSAAVTGGSISAATARVSFNGTAMGAGALDVFAAPGTTAGTHYITDITGVGSGKVNDVNVLALAMTSTGANLSAVTTGEIEVEVDYMVFGTGV